MGWGNDPVFRAAAFESNLTQNSNEIRQYASFLGDDLRTSLASLHFSLPAEEALHAILESKVSNALDKADSNSLVEDRDLVGFDSVLRTVVLQKYNERT